MGTLWAVAGRLTRSPLSAGVALFLVSFALRTTVLLSHLTPVEAIRPNSRNEPAAVAEMLVRTGQYANPYIIPTGPTAHPLPIYTGLVALIYYLFGITLTAGYVRSLVMIAAYSAMYGMLPWVAARLGVGWQAGLIGGLAGALYPAQGLGEVAGWMSGEPLAAVMLGVVLAVFVRRWTAHHGSAQGSFLLGLAIGVSFHLAPALLLVVLGLVAFELWWSRDRRKWIMTAVMGAGVVLACAPWAWRNYGTFHQFFFIRSNFGLELRLGNHDGADADMSVISAREDLGIRHPRINLAEAQRVRQLGEIEYMRQARNEAFIWIASHPAEFLRLTASRVILVWFGPLRRPLEALPVAALTVLAVLGARRVLPVISTPQQAVLLIPLVSYPLVHYVVAYMPRYRVPVDWMLLLFAGAEVCAWFRRE